LTEGSGEGDLPLTYAGAGVDIEAARRAVDRIRDRTRSTFGPRVLSDIGGHGGLFSFDASRYREPVLVSSTDGVGTKVLIAQALGRHDTIGIDLVAMSVDDVAAHGAEPLFFLDYIVIEKLDPALIDQLVTGMAAGCREAGCALIGGETAEHPGHMPPGSYDLAGFCVGVVERERVVTGAAITPGDAVVGLVSSGLHANGFSLVRKVLERSGLSLEDRPAGLPGTLGEELLTPTAIYAPALGALQRRVEVKGIAHVTGGGIPDNLARILPGGVRADIDLDAWQPPLIFDLIAEAGGVEEREMLSTFNMGVGMIAVVGPRDAGAALDVLAGHERPARLIGEILPAAEGEERVRLG
jgi:phosphoribosylformylglycinamidine cyclo-ligase